MVAGWESRRLELFQKPVRSVRKGCIEVLGLRGKKTGYYTALQSTVLIKVLFFVRD